MNKEKYDVVIIGGGPAGATAALCLAREGLSVVVLEKAAFPRFQIGESLLPRNYQLMHELGLAERLKTLPRVRKLGIEFGMGDGTGWSRYWFHDGMYEGPKEAFNIARADFDALLLDAAIEAGAVVHQTVGVTSIERLTDGAVEVAAGDLRFSGRVLIDASGHGTVIGRHLRLRRTLKNPHLQKVAHFAHFEGVERLGGDQEGFPAIVMCEEGWFWIIPLNARHTSVGLVLDPAVAKRIDVPADRILSWGIERCPAVRDRMTRARGTVTNMVRSDFSYRCAPYAGPGYFLAGDAATFLDPIFSTGVCLGMMSAQHSAGLVVELLRGGATPASVRRRHIAFIRSSTGIYFRVIRKYYTHPFRELFLEGRGPLDVHRAILAILAGHVFPRPAWKLRWRVRFFELLHQIQRIHALAPRRARFSLLESPAVALSISGTEGEIVYGGQSVGAV